MLISVSTLSIFNPVVCILPCVRRVDDFTFIPASAQHWSPHTICSLFVIPSYPIKHKTWWVPIAISVAGVLCFNFAFNPFTLTIFLVLPVLFYSRSLIQNDKILIEKCHFFTIRYRIYTTFKWLIIPCLSRGLKKTLNVAIGFQSLTIGLCLM